MKKRTLYSAVLFFISAAVFAGCRFYDSVLADHVPPQISGGEEVIEVSVADSREKLLEGLSAGDDRDGDLTDRIVVQKMSELDGGGTRTVTYAVADDSGNAGYYSRKIKYTDYQPPGFSMSRPLRFPLGRSADLCQGITASGVLDGDLTEKIKYTLDQAIPNLTTGVYAVEFRVTDSAGRTAYLKTEAEMYDPAEEQIQVELSDYLVYLKVNDPFVPELYYSGASIPDAELTITSDVNMSEAGTYTVDYTAAAGTYTGKSRLVVVVGN